MANITAAMVKELREKTGSGMMDCKRALQETDGDMDKAVDYLREKGMADTAKKAGRIAAEGVIASYIHMGGRIGVIVEVNCETDFVAKTDGFREFAQNIAMHIAAANPQYIESSEVPQSEIDHEREVLIAQAKNEGRPDHIIEKMVEGRIKKYYAQVCLLEQSYIRAEKDETVETYLKSAISEFGENIKIRRFSRFEMGEGLEKRSEDFASEVAAQLA